MLELISWGEGGALLIHHKNALAIWRRFSYMLSVFKKYA